MSRGPRYGTRDHQVACWAVNLAARTRLVAKMKQLENRPQVLPTSQPLVNKSMRMVSPPRISRQLRRMDSPTRTATHLPRSLQMHRSQSPKTSKSSRCRGHAAATLPSISAEWPTRVCTTSTTHRVTHSASNLPRQLISLTRISSMRTIREPHIRTRSASNLQDLLQISEPSRHQPLTPWKMTLR